MTPSEWKPTDEMLNEVMLILMGGGGKFISEDDTRETIIAVQPLIAIEARAKAMEEAAAYLKGAANISTTTQLNIFYQSAATAIRALIHKPPEGT